MSKKTKIAINGFGRIGRVVLRIALENPEIEVVNINDPGEVATLAYLFKYDSVYGVYPGTVEAAGNAIIINGQKYPVSLEREPEKLHWQELGVEVVLECTGAFRKVSEAGRHLTAGAKKVIVSAPGKDDGIPTYLIGINEKDYQGEAVINMGSCTTNCIAPVMKVISEKFGIAKSLMSTVHAYTNDQMLVDSKHKDLRRARAAALNIVPTSTGAATAVAKVIPSLKDHFDGLALRVPTPVVSLSDIVLITKQDVTVEQINQALTEAANGELKGILAVTNEQLVSTDFVGNPHSSIVDLSLTKVVDKNLVKIIAWYDNEYGYAKRLVEMVKIVSA